MTILAGIIGIILFIIYLIFRIRTFGELSRLEQFLIISGFFYFGMMFTEMIRTFPF